MHMGEKMMNGHMTHFLRVKVERPDFQTDNFRINVIKEMLFIFIFPV